MLIKSCISLLMKKQRFIPRYVLVLNERAIKGSFQNRNSIHFRSEVCVNVALPLTQERMISTQKRPYNTHPPAFLSCLCPREVFTLSELVGREVNLSNTSEIIMIKQIFTQKSPPDLKHSFRQYGNYASDLSDLSNSSLIRIKSLDSMLVITI